MEAAWLAAELAWGRSIESIARQSGRSPSTVAYRVVDPAGEQFSVSRDGVTRSLRRAREEAGKCVLLCANCHAMVEAGLRDLAAAADHPG